MKVHGDAESKLTTSQYKNFLCNSPIVTNESYGSFRHHYRIDGRLIAVGVVDILPYCLSSVYLYYDPEFECLNLGTLTALKEIEHVRSLSAIYPQLKYYYLGLYIHPCQKMRYKGAYSPSDLLCPIRYTWHPLDACRRALDEHELTMSAGGARDQRCVILSDVCEETVEEDGKPPHYDATSMVQHKHKHKHKHKQKQHNQPQEHQTEAAATATTNQGSKHKEMFHNKLYNMMDDAEYRQGSNDPNTDTSASDPSTSAAPTSPVSSTSRYVFDPSSASSQSHLRRMAELTLPLLPLQLGSHTVTFKQLTSQAEQHLKAPCMDYITRVGKELALQMIVKL